MLHNKENLIGFMQPFTVVKKGILISELVHLKSEVNFESLIEKLLLFHIK